DACAAGETSSRFGIDLLAQPPSRRPETSMAVHFMRSLPCRSLTHQITRGQTNHRGYAAIWSAKPPRNAQVLVAEITSDPLGRVARCGSSTPPCGSQSKWVETV